MKKLKTKKLAVKTATIRNLTEKQLDTVGGGLTPYEYSNQIVAVAGAFVKKC